MRPRIIATAIAVLLLPGLSPAQASEPPSAELAMEKQSLAASIRDKGYACDRVDDMKRVDRFDADIRAGWDVRCGNGRFRVIYIGNPGFDVTPLPP